MYAKVIVDVPAKQTNRPFDYKVPPSLMQWVEIGSRVGVPFGSRMIQGFVVDLVADSDVESVKLKPIERVLDLYPPLNKELIELSAWMSRKYLCPEITALQAMIPGALKAKYERVVSLSDPAEAKPASGFIELPQEREIIAYVREKQSVPIETLLSRFPGEGRLIRKLIDDGILTEGQTIKDRLAKKKVLTVFPPENADALLERIGELPPQARKQKEVLQYLAAHPRPVKLTELMVEMEVNARTVKSLAEKGWIAIKEVEVFRDPYEGRSFQPSPPLDLTGEQQAVLQQILSAVEARSHQVFLLHGVTGSGKTEVYLQAIQHCLTQGREAIVLVPEISLTPQMVERFKSRFGDRVAVLHSRLSHGERYDEWRKIQMRKVSVVIGARSAVFAPFTNLGLIIIDEEHETSYKQEDSPKYHAREVAIRRALQHRAAVVLGSATPSLETYRKAAPDNAAPSETPPFRLLTMRSRVQGRPLPAVHIVDMRQELKDGNRSMFSRPLFSAIEDRLRKQEQMVLLLNRRGHSTFVMCRTCGYVVRCPHCDISLTYHLHSRTLRCHYCGYAKREAAVCPGCGSEHIRYFGTGTQRVEEELAKLFPGIRVIRMDVDTTSEKGSHEKWLTMFRNRQADVLLGTQMVAKGLDFPHVTLVGVIAADTVLHLPDFRSAEKTFQLLTQVAGRAGRHELPGEVFIQTYTPDHYSIVSAGRHDYSAFVRTELELRRQREYPPYCDLILITLSHEQAQLIVRVGESLVKRLKEQWKTLSASALYAPQRQSAYMEVYGPVASPIPRMKDRYRFQCMVKYRGNDSVIELVRRTISAFDDVVKQEKLQISVDIDPQVLM